MTWIMKLFLFPKPNQEQKSLLDNHTNQLAGVTVASDTTFYSKVIIE